MTSWYDEEQEPGFQSRWTCRITCARTHHSRLIDHLTVTRDGFAALRNSSIPVGEEPPAEHHHSTRDIEFMSGPDGAEVLRSHYVLRCPTCSLEVRLSTRLLDRLAFGLRDAHQTRLDLRDLATIVSRQ